jgi:hypothetical protein
LSKFSTKQALWQALSVSFHAIFVPCKADEKHLADGTSLVIGKDRTFTFDAVYGPSSAQELIYTEWVRSVCKKKTAQGKKQVLRPIHYDTNMCRINTVSSVCTHSESLHIAVRSSMGFSVGTTQRCLPTGKQVLERHTLWEAETTAAN